MQYEYALDIEGLKAGSMYAHNRERVLNNGLHVTTRVYGRWESMQLITAGYGEFQNN